MAKKPQPPTQPPLTADDRIDLQIAKTAKEKMERGQTPTTRERQAVRNLEKKREETFRWHYYETVPQAHFRELSGRQPKQFRDLETYRGIRCSGKTVNLRHFVRDVFDWFAANHRRIRDSADDDPMLGDVDSPGLERYRIARADQEEMKAAQMKGELVPVARVYDFHTQFCSLIRKAGERLYRECGHAAGKILDDAMVDGMRVLLQVSHNGEEREEQTG